MKTRRRDPRSQVVRDYPRVLADVVSLLESARQASVRAVSMFMTATYWQIGKRIVESEQRGKARAHYGEELIDRLAVDLSSRFGRGFSMRNLAYMRLFYLSHPILQTPSAKLLPPPHQTMTQKSSTPIVQTSSAQLETAMATFPLPWSHYVRLLSVKNPLARNFYETEALRGGWTVKQLDRQINTSFYERTALSRHKVAMLSKAPPAAPVAEDGIREPFVLEFLGLKDEYSESDLEEALINHLQSFLLELGDDFTFVGRQRRLRIGNRWYRVDLLFFHRVLRCLIVIDLKLGMFTHEDAGQMHLYLNFAREHWVRPGEREPVGLILCSQRDDAVARYTLDNLPNKILAAEYRMMLPNEKLLVAEIEKTREILEARAVTANLAKRRTKNMG
jgi:predicted nuclease of restriction endonuclease-like (RecB) superfamily